jgi:hypothetical protein
MKVGLSLPAPSNDEIYTGGSIDDFREIGSRT